MPEGDSYAFAALRIRPVLVGHRVTSVEGSAPSVRRHSGALLERVVESVRTRGKHLLIDFSVDLSVHIHLGMAGRVQTTRAGRSPVGEGRGVRLAVTTEMGTVRVIGAPTVEVERRRVIDRSLDHLGPDLLAGEFDLDRFRIRAGRYPGAATLADFLLDQPPMAGVGNEYKSEVLFLEGLSPHRTVGSVGLLRLEGLAERARRLLSANRSRAIRSTIGRGDGSLWVYGRAGRPCRRCRTAVEEGWVGDPPRITFWCPSCQS